jgi:hypothetical protein
MLQHGHGAGGSVMVSKEQGPPIENKEIYLMTDLVSVATEILNELSCGYDDGSGSE